MMEKIIHNILHISGLGLTIYYIYNIFKYNKNNKFIDYFVMIILLLGEFK